MMEKDEEKLLLRRRMEKWMKIFVIFLAFVWLCTIISKSIYVSGLPIVKTDTASKKYVEHIVNTDGIVTAGGEIAVNTQAGLRVDKIYVHEGDAVQAGDVLFTIDTSDLTELISAKETELSKLQCNLSDWQVNAVIDAQKKEVAILWAKEDYETADKETAVAKARAKEALDKAEAALGKHLADTVPYTADNARRNAWDMYHDWVNKGYGIADKITAKEREIQDLEEQLAELENRIGKEVRSGEEGQPKVLSGSVGADTDNTGGTEDTNTGEDNSDAGNTQNGAENTDGHGNADTGTNTDAADSTENESENANTNTDDTDSTENENENANTDDTDSTENENENANTDDTDSVENGNENTETGALAPDTKDNQNPNPADEEKRTELLNKIKKANEELLALRDQLTKHDRDAVAQPDYSAEEAEYDAWQSTKLTLEENVQRAKESYNDASYTREVTLRQKLREIANAETTSKADSTAMLYELDIKQAKKQIERLHAIKQQKGEIKAENDGIISKIQIEVGGRTSDTAALLLTDALRPCQFKFSITKEEGKYVHLNDTVELKLNGQSTATEVTVDYLTENTQGGYDILCMLPENMGQPGLSGTVQKAVQGEYHELALPVEAVFEERDTFYIYTLNEKEGILGSEYYAEKIKVQVKDQNDRYAAIEAGTISKDTKVITYSTEELKQGQSVRPQDK
ncbi:MAG: biotin/lipoyl-binding protein [Lachnospiraceae bacterium]|nr:biotin/lipoyl-binding protein [Lachnospiraceae bacterium]